MIHPGAKKEEPMFDNLAEYVSVVTRYDFIVSVIAVAMMVYWIGAKLRQWRLEEILRRMWEKRNQEMRSKKLQKDTQEQRVQESKS
jgi:hypothetical protein